MLFAGGRIGDGKRDEDQDKMLQVNDDVYLPHLSGWAAPNQYAFLETRIVRRSNILLFEHGRNLTGYGCELNMRQITAVASKASAQTLRRSQGSSKAEEEELKQNGMLYDRGEGAPKDERKRAQTRYFVEADNGNARVQLDAGDAYEETGHMVIEVALCVLYDCDKSFNCCEIKGGVLTPAVAAGDKLLRRLNGTGMYIRPVQQFDPIPKYIR